MNALTPTPARCFAKSVLLLCIVLVTFAGHCHKHKHADPSVHLEEKRERSVMDDPAVRGELPFEWLFGNPQPGTEPADQEDVAEFLETFKNSTAPKIVEIELLPGAMHVVELQLAGPSNLTGSAQWIGTASPLKVTISVNGSTLVTGTGTSTGKMRGESNLQAQTPIGGRSTMAVINTSNAKVKVRMLLLATAL